MDLLYNPSFKRHLGLFDTERAYKLVSKVIQIASSMEAGAFDYNRLVSDISSEQLLIGAERDVIEAVVEGQTLEPMKTHVPATKDEERDQWKVIV